MSISDSSRSESRCRLLGQLFHPVEFHAQLFAAFICEPVRLLVPRRVFLIERFDEAVFDQPANRSVERAGAQAHAPLTQTLDVFDQGVTVAWFVCKAGEDEKYRLR